MDWQPIATAPREKIGGCANVILLASDSGHRALGYWGKGIDGVEGWINIHDHLRMNYWNAFTHWMPAPEPPRPAR